MNDGERKQIEYERSCLAKHRAEWIRLDTSQVLPVNALIRERMVDVGKNLEMISKNWAGTVGRYNKILYDCVPDKDWNTIAYIGLSIVFESMTAQFPTIQEVVLRIGQEIEDNYRFMLFELENKKVFDLVKDDLRKRGSKKYDHAKRVLTAKMENMEWEQWSKKTTAHIGTLVLSEILEEYDDVIVLEDVNEGVRIRSVLKFTEEYKVWKEEFLNEASLFNISRGPLKIAPEPWTGNRGGWYTEKLKVNIVKWRGPGHKKHGGVSQEVRDALDKQGRVKWKINTEMLKRIKDAVNSKGIEQLEKYNLGVLKEYPKHFNQDPNKMEETEEKEYRAWKLERSKVYTKRIKANFRMKSLGRTLRTVTDLLDWDGIHFVYNCDFVGRMYCNSIYLSTQGTDVEKSLLDFATSVKVTKEGADWIRVHTAKCFGVKGTRKELIRWYVGNLSMIQSIKENPADYRWTLAKKPFCFLRACLEDLETSNLPVGIDGVCNGLQHYAAMFRDEITARNLGMIGKTKSDIYSKVAEIVKKKLAEDSSEIARFWLKQGIDRDFMKKPVMLLSFGITKNSLSRKLSMGMLEKGLGYRGSECLYLSDIIWGVFEEELVAVIKGMEILKNRTESFMTWVTPTGFKVYQPYVKQKKIVIHLTIKKARRMKLRSDTEEVNNRKQKQSYPANYIHSMDASHAVRIINAGPKDIRGIHDDFACHCNYVSKLQKTIRDTFVDMYKNMDEEALGVLNLDDINEENFFE